MKKKLANKELVCLHRMKLLNKYEPGGAAKSPSQAARVLTILLLHSELPSTVGSDLVILARSSSCVGSTDVSI
jgi:hypothetical protein